MNMVEWLKVTSGITEPIASRDAKVIKFQDEAVDNSSDDQGTTSDRKILTYDPGILL